MTRPVAYAQALSVLRDIKVEQIRSLDLIGEGVHESSHSITELPV